ncbi:MAG TPA: CHAT domain-containing protein [Streptosporangiaceae bacterium]|nr:CHAT domain-containing protein [Streptosporangiaceae bacterium]
MIRVLVDVGEAQPDGWKVSLRCSVLDAPIARMISRLDGPCGGYPVVPPDDLPAGLPAAARALATASDPGLIDDMRINLATGQPGDGEIATFGAYLHAVLFGGNWAAIASAAAGEHLEVALRFPAGGWELMRLPWEIVQAPGQGGLAWSPITWHAVITRLVSSADARGGGPDGGPGGERRELTVTISPRVLFVVGTDFHDESIRPGAEFFTVWELLQQEQLRQGHEGVLFDFRVLQRASSQRIEDEIASFRPSIVHFICHGDQADDGGYICMASIDEQGRPVTDRRDARRLLDLLRGPGDSYPAVVVLSACYSASQPGQPGQPSQVSARVDAPLAAALVRGGVPIVVGMGGQVSDLACRLFARSFYKALLSRHSVTAATAEGRRAGMKHGADPGRTIDWALPMLFLADGLSPEIEVDPGESQRMSRLAKLASGLRDHPNPLAFCDRIEIMQAQRALLDPRQRLRVLVLDESDYEPDPQVPDRWGRFGKTRTLREIAARSVVTGHLPCLLTFGPGDVRPTSPTALLLALTRAVKDAAKLAGRTAPFDAQLGRLYALVTGRAGACPDDLCAAVRDEYELGANADDSALFARVISEALHFDLRELARIGRAELNCPDLGVIVLVDDVHMFDAAARTFLKLIGIGGLGDADLPAPVAFTYSSQPRQAGYQSSVSLIRKFVEDNGQDAYFSYLPLERFKSSDLAPFSSPDSLRSDPLSLVYRQYLLNLRPGIVLHRDATPDAITWFLSETHERVLGVPSRLEVTPQQRIQDFIQTTLRMQKAAGALQVIDEVNDEQMLLEFRSLVR